MKTFLKDEMTDEQLTELRSEIAVHKSLSHPSIVTLDSVFETRNRVHVFTERMHGGELFDRVVNAGRFSEQHCAEVAAQLLQALVYLHDRHVVHRDVKLENLIFENQDENSIRLIDFGLATTLDPPKKLAHSCGTLDYAAPEMLAGRPYDQSVDVWSAGVCVYTMLTGRRLVVNGWRKFGIRFHALPLDAQDFVTRLVCEDPRKRASARTALKHPWLAKHVSAQSRNVPPQPRKRLSLVWQKVPELMLGGLTFGAMTACNCGDSDAGATALIESLALAAVQRAK